LVQGAVGGIVGSLGLAENVWVQSLEISVDDRGFSQRITYLGGGLAAMATNVASSPSGALLLLATPTHNQRSCRNCSSRSGGL